MREHVDAVADALVLLRVVAERHAVSESERAGVGLAHAREDPEQVVFPAPFSPMTSSRSPRPTSNDDVGRTPAGPP